MKGGCGVELEGNNNEGVRGGGTSVHTKERTGHHGIATQVRKTSD